MRIELGATPVNEECAQVGSLDYEKVSVVECRAYLNQLKRYYEAVHNKLLPVGCRLKVASCDHDFGAYKEVVAVFDLSDSEAADAASWLESNGPENWDCEARKELS